MEYWDALIEDAEDLAEDMETGFDDLWLVDNPE